MAQLLANFESRYFRAALYDNQGASGLSSHEVILTRKENPRESLVIDAGVFEPWELRQVASRIAALKGEWTVYPAELKSSEWSFAVHYDCDEVWTARLSFFEPTSRDPETRSIPIFEHEADDLLAIANNIAERHAQLNLLSHAFHPDHKLVLTLTHGRFHAEIFEVASPAPGYLTAVYCDGTILWPPYANHKCGRMFEQLKEGGEDSLNSYLTARGLPPPAAKDLLDFQKTLVESELRFQALREEASNRPFQIKNPKLLAPHEITPAANRETDFGIAELTECSWKITPLTPRAQEHIERPRVKKASWEEHQGGYVMHSPYDALELIRHLASCRYTLQIQWLDPQKEQLKGQPSSSQPKSTEVSFRHDCAAGNIADNVERFKDFVSATVSRQCLREDVDGNRRYWNDLSAQRKLMAIASDAAYCDVSFEPFAEAVKDVLSDIPAPAREEAALRLVLQADRERYELEKLLPSYKGLEEAPSLRDRFKEVLDYYEERLANERDQDHDPEISR
jgi:hypothetical protein